MGFVHAKMASEKLIVVTLFRNIKLYIWVSFILSLVKIISCRIGAYIFLGKCWFTPVPPDSCPSNIASLKKCTVPETQDELCEAIYLSELVRWPVGTGNINNCGNAEVYTTSCRGTYFVSNPRFKIIIALFLFLRSRYIFIAIKSFDTCNIYYRNNVRETKF